MQHFPIFSTENVRMQIRKDNLWRAELRPARTALSGGSEPLRPRFGYGYGIVRYHRQFPGEEPAEDQTDRCARNNIGTEVRGAFDPRYADEARETVEDAPVFWKVL